MSRKLRRLDKVPPELTVRVLVPPVEIDVDGCSARVLEALEYKTVFGETRYFVAVKVACSGKESPVFRVDAKDDRELIWKLKAEVATFKLREIYSF